MRPFWDFQTLCSNFFLIFAPIFRWNQKSCEVEDTFSIFKKMFPELQWFNNLCDWLWRPRGSVTAEVRVATGAWTNIQFSIISSSIFWQNCVEDGWNPNWDQSSLLSNEFLIDFHPRIINISQHANTSSAQLPMQIQISGQDKRHLDHASHYSKSSYFVQKSFFFIYETKAGFLP